MKHKLKLAALSVLVSLSCTSAWASMPKFDYGPVTAAGVPTSAAAGTSIANPHSENVVAENVVFKNEETGVQLSGIIYTPKTKNKQAKNPAVIVSGPMMSVKEQPQSLYAQRIAALGYVTMVFDYSYFGTSGGEPRSLEDPQMKAKDIKSAVSFLQQLSYVEKNHIAGVGICGSGSYMPLAASTDPRIKAVVSVVPFTVMNTAAEHMQLDVDKIHKDKEAWEKGLGGPTYIVMITPGSEGGEYYYNPKRNKATTWKNYALSWSIDEWKNFNPEDAAEKLTQPYLVITSEKAFTLEMAKGMYKAAKTQKSYYEIKNARHFDMYDLDPYVTDAVDKIKGFLSKNI